MARRTVHVVLESITTHYEPLAAYATEAEAREAAERFGAENPRYSGYHQWRKAVEVPAKQEKLWVAVMETDKDAFQNSPASRGGREPAVFLSPAAAKAQAKAWCKEVLSLGRRLKWVERSPVKGWYEPQFDGDSARWKAPLYIGEVHNYGSDEDELDDDEYLDFCCVVHELDIQPAEPRKAKRKMPQARQMTEWLKWLGPTPQAKPKVVESQTRTTAKKSQAKLKGKKLEAKAKQTTAKKPQAKLKGKKSEAKAKRSKGKPKQAQPAVQHKRTRKTIAKAQPRTKK